MKFEYIVDNEYLAQRCLDLNDYALNGELIPAIVYQGLDIVVNRCCYLNDTFKGEKSIELELDKDSDKVDTFKKLQYHIIYNLIFTAEDNPVDLFIDNIIVYELGWGKINGFQKGLWYKNN